MGRKVIPTKLTPLGRKIPEQLRKANEILYEYNKGQRTEDSKIIGKQENDDEIIKCAVCGYEIQEGQSFEWSAELNYNVR